jgi:uncharacterized Zn finger protein
MTMFSGGWRPYVPVAKRREKAARTAAALRKSGHEAAPVRIAGRAIAHTFWGKAWCENLERYSDYANRLPRGRTYVRNGSVIDLQIAAGKVSALVQGSSLYRVAIEVAAVPRPRWDALRRDCAGAIGSLVELLQGRFARGVMERICARETGLFPAPREIRLSCSCPDWAEMCKHVAAVLYGVGARLDERPELLFVLRGVDSAELIPARVELATTAAPVERVLADEGLGELFGIELGEAASAPANVAVETPVASVEPPAPKAARPSRAPKARQVPPKPRRAKAAPGVSDSLRAAIRAAVREALADELGEPGRRASGRRPAAKRRRRG